MRKTRNKKTFKEQTLKKRGAVMFFFHSMRNELTFLCFNFKTKPPAYLQKLDKHPTAKVGHLDIVSFPRITRLLDSKRSFLHHICERKLIQFDQKEEFTELFNYFVFTNKYVRCQKNI